MGAASDFLIPFVGALQAAISVLLQIVLGVLCAQFKLISQSSASEVATTCVKVLLPALLIASVGKELDIDTVGEFAPVLVWGLVYTFASMGFGILTTRMFNLPSWVTPALCFNNTTSLPLLLTQSLESTGLLEPLLAEGQSASAAVAQAKSFFLVNAMISNSICFAAGPALLEKQKKGQESEEDGSNESGEDEQRDAIRGDTEHPGGNRFPVVQNGDSSDDTYVEQHGDAIDEQTSLLPRRAVRKTNAVVATTHVKVDERLDQLPSWVRSALHVGKSLVNAPVIGAVIGIIIGLTPTLHRWFFNDFNDGGYLNVAFTQAIKNIGDLFASLQIIVVGVQLAQSLRRMKDGRNSGHLPWKSTLYIFLFRFIVWPLISIPFIWILAKKTGLLDNDAILWFVLMLMPCGPPAMILTALADVNDCEELEKMAIAKLLTLSYLFTPLICFAVVGSLKVSQAAMSS